MHTSSMDSSFPVTLPEDSALFVPDGQFEQYIHSLLSNKPRAAELVTGNEAALEGMGTKNSTSDGRTVVSGPAGSSKTATLESATKTPETTGDSTVQTSHDKFVDAFLDEINASSIKIATPDLSAENKMLTANAGPAYRSTTSSLLDLFSELEKTISGPRLRELLEAAWKEDSLATLKIVWNARSIHLGKGEKESFYRCLAWMSVDHPGTVVANLQWIYRSVIEKKVKKEDEDAPVMVEREDVTDEDQHEVPYGVSHGYWKDLLNILVLAVEGQFNVLTDPRSSLNKKNEQPKTSSKLPKHKRKYRGLGHMQKTSSHEKDTPAKKSHHDRVMEAVELDQERRRKAKDEKHKQEAAHHANVLTRFDDRFYRALHMTVARLFAAQLRKDMDLLKSGTRKDLNNISLAAKWAPSLEGFHDKHTLVASSIAEILYPKSFFDEPSDSREMHLKRAREAYRRLTLSPLRKVLEVVERDISAETFKNINYEKVPSIAMDNNKDLFAHKDFHRFERYIRFVAKGKSRISAAVLTPATLVKQANSPALAPAIGPRTVSAKQLFAARMAWVQKEVLDSQWRTLVKRIQDNGKLSSSIAVCDVSGSMYGPLFPDGTCPMDSAVGLSLLLAEVTAPPFGGLFITFSSRPEALAVGGQADTRKFDEKVNFIRASQWSMNTDFVAVFERLLLPVAIRHKLKQEDMVKRVFVFSDMQFDQAEPTWGKKGENPEGKWDTAFKRIKKKYRKAGYEMPELVFWNLAGGRAGYTGFGDPIAPKPVTAHEQNATLVTGYSQGTMKMFLEEGTFGDGAEEAVDEIMAEAGGDDEALVEIQTKKKDPMAGVWKAIGHNAYDMLRVID